MRRILCWLGFHKWRSLAIDGRLFLADDWFLCDKSKDLADLKAGRLGDSIITTCKACGVQKTKFFPWGEPATPSHKE